MIEKWTPLPRPKEGAKADELMDWFAQDITAFQSAHPELPQKFVGQLNAKDRKIVVRAYQEARDEADVAELRKKNPKLADVIARANKTRTITSKSPKKRRP